MAEELIFDDVDLDADAADEAAKLTVEDPEDNVEDTEEEIEEEVTSEEEKEVSDPQAEIRAYFEDLRAERQRLQEQLNELSVTTLTGQRKVEELEKALKKARAKPAPKEETGPSPQEIMAHLDQRIAQVDAALAKAEAEDPAAAPELRKQLRQLERYANNYSAQLLAAANKGADPEALVQQAVLETNQQARFNMVKNHVTSQYPILDKDSEYYDEKLAAQIHRVYNPMLKEGEDPADALLESVALVTAARGVLSIAQLQELHAKQEAEKAAKAKEAPAKKPGAEQRKKDAVKRNIEAAAATPPNIANLGTANSGGKLLDKYDLEKMPINEFLRISDEEMDKLEAQVLSMYD